MEKPENPNNVFEPMPDEAEALPAAETPAASPAAEKLAEARKNLKAGLLWCIGGLALSFISYYFTEAGGRYIVATGAIIWGVIDAVRGLVVILRLQYKEGRYAAFWRTAAAAAGSVVLLLYLGQLSLRLADGEEALSLVSTEQHYACDSLGLRVTVPPGYTAIQTVGQPETEQTYAFYQLTTYNENIGMSIDGIVDFIDPEQVTSIADLKEFCQQRDSAFYDKGFVIPTRLIEVGGRPMLESEGRSSKHPGLVYTSFDMAHGSALVSVSFWYTEKEHGKGAIRRRIEELLANIRFD